MQDSWSYTKDSGDFLKKIKNIGKIPAGAFLVAADIIRLYPSISHEAGLEALWKKFSERDSPKVPTGLVKTKSDFTVRSVETGLGKWTLVVAVTSVDAYPFLAFSNLTCQPEDTGIGVFWLHCAAG